LVQNLGKKCIKLYVIPKGSNNGSIIFNDSLSVISKADSQENYQILGEKSEPRGTEISVDSQIPKVQVQEPKVVIEEKKEEP